MARRRSPRAQQHEIDLAILDISMPKLTGLQAARRILEYKPDVQVLMLSMHDNEEFLFEALRVGAAGYVLKSSAESDLVERLPDRDPRRAVPVPEGGRRARARLPRAECTAASWPRART